MIDSSDVDWFKYHNYIERGSALLTEVLKLDVDWFKKENLSSIKYKFVNNGEIKYDVINIYELAHLCKEWAYKHGFILYSTNYGNECYIDGRIFQNNENIRFFGASEPLSIFKACYWILGEIKKEK